MRAVVLGAALLAAAGSAQAAGRHHKPKPVEAAATAGPSTPDPASVPPAAAQTAPPVSQEAMVERITWVVRNTDLAPRAVVDVTPDAITWIVPALVHRTEDNHIRAWFRSESLDTSSAGATENPLSSLEYYEIDCAGRRQKLLSAKYAAGHSLTGASKSLPTAPDWVSVAAETVGDRRLTTACSPVLAPADASISELRGTLTRLKLAKANDPAAAGPPAPSLKSQAAKPSG